MSQPGRTLTIAAVGFLLLDAVLLAIAGLWAKRPGLLVGAGACAVAVVGVIVAWRRYRRAMEEVAAARRAMKSEVESIRDLLHQAHFHN